MVFAFWLYAFLTSGSFLVLVCIWFREPSRSSAPFRSTLVTPNPC
jgi:hypothetical protein